MFVVFLRFWTLKAPVSPDVDKTSFSTLSVNINSLAFYSEHKDFVDLATAPVCVKNSAAQIR